ncbi:MAG: hypothetical protein K2Q20_05220, partial [Phycisphaerales bacterium]|nr:hypothetical protein [Phycisphaerales bacterium]
MRRFSVRSLCALGVAFAASLASAQTTITQWNFNTPSPSDANVATGTFTPSIGAGTAQPFNIAPASPLSESIFASGVGSTDTNATDNSGWQTRGYQTPTQAPGSAGPEFAVSTASYSNIIITWDQRHSNTSSRFCALWYSTDGVTFTRFPTTFTGETGDTWFNGRTVDLSSIAAVNNNPNFKFRISPVYDPAGTAYVASNTASTYAGSGTYRYDMVTVSGTAVASIAPSAAGASASPGAVC